MRRFRLLIPALAWMAAAPQAFAQAPVIEAIQNSASNISITEMAPEVLLTIKGQNLATSVAAAHGYPLPTRLGGATVTFGGANGPADAPLLYVSPTQIDLQVPAGIVNTSLTVTTVAGASAPYAPPYIITLVGGTYPYLIGPLGIFTQDSSGCGQAVAYNVHPDGSVTLNTPQTSLDPDKDVGLTIYLTGLGSAEVPGRLTGLPWTGDASVNLASAFVTPAANLAPMTFGAAGLTRTAADLTLAYLGPAPGKVGVDQANALGQWKGSPQGCKVPLSLGLTSSQTAYYSTGMPPGTVFVPVDSSQLVDVSIQPGGGVCADPPENNLGIVSWQATTVSDLSGLSSTEAITAQFIQSGGLGFAPPVPQDALAASAPLTPDSPVYGSTSVPPPAACNASLPDTLDAGALTVSGGGLSNVALQPSTQSGRLTYQATLAAGTLAGGAYRIMGQGGGQVGDFTAEANIPPPITGITVANGESSNLQPGTNLPPPCVSGFAGFCPDGYVFNWTGGDDRSIVTIQMIIGGGFEAAVSASAASEEAFILSAYGTSLSCEVPGLCTLLPSGNVEIVVTQTPAQAPSEPFSAPGLGAGGEATWKYVWDFRDLTNY